MYVALLKMFFRTLYASQLVFAHIIYGSTQVTVSCGRTCLETVTISTYSYSQHSSQGLCLKTPNTLASTVPSLCDKIKDSFHFWNSQQCLRHDLKSNIPHKSHHSSSWAPQISKKTHGNSPRPIVG